MCLGTLCHRYARIMGNSTFMTIWALQGGNLQAFQFYNNVDGGFIAKSTMAVYYTWYAGKSRCNRLTNNKALR
jgi:hypothetical protein